jgi:hypothetical protein
VRKLSNEPTVSWIPVDKEILKRRMEVLGLKPWQITKIYSRIRAQRYGDLDDPRRYSNTINKAMENPDKSSIQTIQALVEALDGELVIRWNKREEVLIKQEIVDMGGKILED